jgi:hypothetical protein
MGRAKITVTTTVYQEDLDRVIFRYPSHARSLPSEGFKGRTYWVAVTRRPRKKPE